MTFIKTPPIIQTAGDLLVRYDVLFCDVWGVTHNGQEAHAGANTALKRFRNGGGTVILVSNAPVPAAQVHNMLKRVGVWDDAWDEIVCSGDIALDHIAQKGYARLYGIGPADRDEALFSKLPGRTDNIEDADAIVCTGLNDDAVETAQSYLPILKRALDADLPFVCANPDLVVDVGGRSYLCAGVIAQAYEDIGGAVFWAGKPHPSAYDSAHRLANTLRATDVPKHKILSIGDAIRTDLKAAQIANIDALFITSGIHSREIMHDNNISQAKLAKLFKSDDAPTAIAAMAQLTW